MRPCTNSAPRSTGTGQSPPRSVKIRPPTRSRDSSTRTVQPAWVSRTAAASPDTPAPSTSTSVCVASPGPDCTDAFGHETLKARLEGPGGALPIDPDEVLAQEEVSRGLPRAPILGRHRPFDAVLHVGFLEHAEKHVGDMEAPVLLLAGGGGIVEQREQVRMADTDFADAIHALLEGGVRFAHERSSRPGVVGCHAHENEGGRREDTA